MSAAVPPEPARPPDDETTGFKVVRTWRTVYLLVLGSFILWVALLALLTRTFS
jgi:hypothetical protein